MKHGHKVAVMFLGIIIGHVFTFMTIVAVDKVFLENPGLQEIEKMLNDPSIPKPDPDNPTVTIDLGKASWPWYAKVFYCVILSFAWFIFGRVASIVAVNMPWVVFFIPPIITSLLFGDLFLPLYLGSSYLGIRQVQRIQPP